MDAVILAGGKGTRMGPLSEELPKPLVQICGVPIIKYLIDYYIYWGVKRILICCGYRYQDFFSYIGTLGKRLYIEQQTIIAVIFNGCEIIAVNTGEETGTGGRIKRVKEFINTKRFFLTYGDGLSDVDLKALCSQHEQANNIVTLTAVHPMSKFGVLQFDNHLQINCFYEKGPLTNVWINGGYMVVDEQIYDYIESDSTSLERDCFPKLVSDGKIGVFQHLGIWQCMDTIEERNLLELLVKQERLPWNRHEIY